MEEKNKWRECREIDFPTLLKRTREELGLTQSEFGRGFGVGLTTVSMWENGKRKVGKDVVEFLVSKELDRAREEGRKAERDRIFRGLDSIDCIKEALPKNYSASGMQFGIYRAKEIVLEKELSKLTTK